MTPGDRARFDRELEQVLAGLPERVHKLLEEVPLVVEDYPSQKLIEDLGLEYRDDLCGLYQGVALIDREVDGHPSQHLDTITIFREGIVGQSLNERGAISVRELRRQIRITILHELGHHFGMDEDELEALGYG
jgi:predicted Zn-dependent protease with MMP-like domain